MRKIKMKNYMQIKMQNMTANIEVKLLCQSMFIQHSFKIFQTARLVIVHKSRKLKSMRACFIRMKSKPSMMIMMRILRLQ